MHPFIRDDYNKDADCALSNNKGVQYLQDIEKEVAAEVKQLYLQDGRVIILSDKDLDRNLFEMFLAEGLE